MALSKEQWIFEKERLNKLFGLITDNIDRLEGKLKDSVSMIRNSNKVMWESGKSYHYDFDDVVENLSLLDGVYSDIMRHENILIQLKKMYLLRKNAYFGRVDFLEEGLAKKDEIYIGTSTLEGDKAAILIYDWRAAISSMFYECETGKAGFESPSGRIDGELLMKRQYRIFLNDIESMFDSSLIIEDEILQSILSESKNSRMNTIVSSIQKEQNKAIRDEQHKVVYVDGPAGSGKTSIALHRAAWLLYRYREKMKARNIIVYSPNEIFNDYISNVLPELGEENMQMSTFMQLAESYLGQRYRFEDYYSQMESVLADSEHINKDSIREKGSLEFASAIENFVKTLEKGGYEFEDIDHNGNELATKMELETLFYKDYNMHRISTRLEKLHTLLEKRLIFITRKIRKSYVDSAKRDQKEGKKAAYVAKSTIEELRKKAYKITHPDPFRLFERFLKESGREKLAAGLGKTLDENRVLYEDLAPVMYLKQLLGYSRDSKEIKHLIIDEVQDYSYVEMLVFLRMFNNIPMTLLGDANQAINHLIDSNDLKSSVAGESYTVKLEKSYRSTKQIAEFCNKLISRELGYEYVDRDGSYPRVERYSKSPVDIIKKLIETYKKTNSSVAVIAKTAASANRLFKMLDSDEIMLIKKSDSSFRIGTVVLPSYLAKGLEFDAVILVDSELEHFSGKENHKLFYTCCSRALHELCILYEKTAPYGVDDF